MKFIAEYQILELLSQDVQFNVPNRRKYYVYLDYTEDGSDFYYIFKGTGPRKDQEQQNSHHDHYRKQRGLDRRVIIERLTASEAEELENLFIHYARENGVYLTNVVFQDYMFRQDWTFDEIFEYYCLYFAESSYSYSWLRNEVFNQLGKFDEIVYGLMICLQAMYLVKENNQILSEDSGRVVKELLLKTNVIGERVLMKLISDMITELKNEEFESFCIHCSEIAGAIDEKDGFQLQLLIDRCIRNLVSSLPVAVKFMG